MSHCVFIHRSDSIYDDSPAEKYQFPKQYLNRAQQSVGDWILYLEPTKVFDTRGYFAVAQVTQIIPDTSVEGMYLALIAPNSYLDFPNFVKFSGRDGPIEKGLLNDAGRLSGRAQAAIRPISNADFRRIVETGLEEQLPLLPRDTSADLDFGFAESQTPFIFDQERERITNFSSRVNRDRAFRQLVLRAYDERCAISGLKFINGGGRAEVNAAHIKPVESNGPDIVNNGIALSGTAHWMFDRGLISLGDDLEILISRHANDQAGIRKFINDSGFAVAPHLAQSRPDPRFLDWHRNNLFKQ